MSYGDKREKVRVAEAAVLIGAGVPLPSQQRTGNGGLRTQATPSAPTGRLFACFEYTEEQLRLVEARLIDLRDRLMPIFETSPATEKNSGTSLPTPSSPLEARLMEMCARLVGLQQTLGDIHSRLQL